MKGDQTLRLCRDKRNIYHSPASLVGDDDTYRIVYSESLFYSNVAEYAPGLCLHLIHIGHATRE